MATIKPQESHSQLKTEIADQLKRIAASVEADGEGQRIDWGNVGDLTHVLTQLKEILKYR